jgi:hypothetical protein
MYANHIRSPTCKYDGLIIVGYIWGWHGWVNYAMSPGWALFRSSSMERDLYKHFSL